MHLNWYVIASMLVFLCTLASLSGRCVAFDARNHFDETVPEKSSPEVEEGGVEHADSR
jgi:hypothetical protein